MKRCIKYYPTNSRFKFLFKPYKFYFYKPAGIYMMRSEPTIYLKEFGDNVLNVQLYDYETNQLIPFYNPNYFELTINDYVVITYRNGVQKKFQLEYVKFGLLELVEKNLAT